LVKLLIIYYALAPQTLLKVQKYIILGVKYTFL